MFNSIFTQSQLRALLLFFILFNNNIIISQTNLVPNYSFESYNMCPSAAYIPPPPPCYLPISFYLTVG